MKTIFNLIALLVLSNIIQAQDLVVPVTATTGFQNGTASGTYNVWYGENPDGTAHTQIEKPFIIVEGIDFFENIDPTYVYNSFGVMAHQLKSEGYDVIVIDYDNSGTFIQRNAFMVARAIQLINAEKNNSEEGMIVGFSMGGLVVRYALTWMEQQDLDHQMKYYFSYDAPHYGANLPLSLQNLAGQIASLPLFDNEDSDPVIPGFTIPQIETNEINFVNPINGNTTTILPEVTIIPETTVPTIDLPHHTFNAISAQQMLVYHRAFTAADGTPNPSPLFTAFQNDITSLNDNNGFPELCENVAISNARKDGIGVGTPGMDAVSFANNNPDGFLELTLDLRTVSNTSATKVLDYHKKIGPLPADDRERIVAPALPYDNAPGSYLKWFKYIFEGLDAIGFGNTELNLEKECFMPTVSALGFDTEDLYYNIYEDPEFLCKTEFDYYYAPMSQKHFHGSVSLDASYWFLQFIYDNYWNIAYSSQSYNYADQTDNFIYQDVTISNAGKLLINDYTYSGQVNSSAPIGFAEFGSNFKVYTSCKTPVTVTVDANGTIEIGDENAYSTGELHIKSGSTLELKAGSEVIIHNNSKLIIDEGATLIYHEGASIKTNGNEAYADIRGNLIIKENATFTIDYMGSQSGYLAFTGNPTITAESNTSVSIQGSDDNDHILQVNNGKVHFPSTLKSLFIRDALVNGNQGIIESSVNYTRYMSSSFNNVSLYSHGNQNALTTNCIFYNTYIEADDVLGTKNLMIFNSEFYNSEILTKRLGVSLSDNTFIEGGFGWTAEKLKYNSSIKRCTFDEYYYPIYIESGQSHISAMIKECTFNHSATAIWAKQSDIKLACSEITYSDNAILIEDQAELFMNTSQSLGYNTFSNNSNHIQCNSSGLIHMNEGYNHIPNQTGYYGGKLVTPQIKGTIDFSAGSILANNNKWYNSNLNGPASRTYRLRNLNNAVISIVDNNPTEPVDCDSKNPTVSYEIKDRTRSMTTAKSITRRIGRQETNHEEMIEEAFEFSIYPTIANQFVMIDIEGVMELDHNISIYNLNGQLIESKTLNQSKTKINTSNYHSGIYFIQFEIDGKIINEKVLIQH